MQLPGDPPTQASPELERATTFSTPIATTCNTVVRAVAVTLVTLDVLALATYALPSGPTLPKGAFIVFFLPIFPLWGWVVLVLTIRSQRERLRRGLPRRRTLREGLRAQGAFADLPEGYLRPRDKVAMAAGMAIALSVFWASAARREPASNVPFMGMSIAFLTGSSVVANAEHRWRAARGMRGVLRTVVPPVPAPRAARSRPLIAWLLACGLGVASLGAAVSIARSNDYQYGEARLVSDGTATVQLPGGDDVIFVGRLLMSEPAPFTPAQVTIVELSTGTAVPARWDPSTDHNSPDGIPALGLISFDAPRDGRYRIRVAGPSGLELFVGRNPGAEARLLGGWLALLAAGLAILAAGTVLLIMRVNWRYGVVRARRVNRTLSVEEWMASGGADPT